MDPVVEGIILFALKLITPDVIKGAEKQFVDFLQALAEKSDNQVDDELVKKVAVALGVEL